MFPIIRIAIQSDFDGILGLQSRNLYTNLSPTELAGGFVTTPFTSDLLGQLLVQLAQQDSPSIAVPRLGVGGMRVSDRLHPLTRRKGIASGRWAGV